MAKILFLNAFYKPDVGGGAEVTMSNIVNNAKKSGFEVSVIATTKFCHDREDVFEGVHIHRVGINNIYWHLASKEKVKILRLLWAVIDVFNPFMAIKLYRIARKEKPDLFVFHNLVGWSSSAYFVARILKIKVVQVLHDYYNLCPNSMMFSDGVSCKNRCLKCRVMRMPNKYLSKSVNGVVGVSEYILRAHLNNGFYGNAFLKRTIVNAKKIDCHDPVFTSPGDPIRFGFIGTIIPAKGIELAVEAFSELPNDLVVAGKGSDEYVGYLKSIAGNNVNFIGHVPQDVFFKKIDVLIVPSIWDEPLGNVVFEAFAYGVPVIGSHRGGIPEMIMHGENGFLFDPDNPDSLMEIINKFIGDISLLNKMKQRAQLSVVPFLDTKKWGESYIDVFNSVISDQV